MFVAGDTGPMLDAIEEFLTGKFPTDHSARVLATVLYSDIIGFTAAAFSKLMGAEQFGVDASPGATGIATVDTAR